MRPVNCWRNAQRSNQPAPQTGSAGKASLNLSWNNRKFKLLSPSLNRSCLSRRHSLPNPSWLRLKLNLLNLNLLMLPEGLVRADHAELAVVELHVRFRAFHEMRCDLLALGHHL